MAPDPLQGILITGSSGQVGGQLLRALTPLSPQLGPVHAPLRKQLDLSDPASIRATLRRVRPRWILNPAAYTAVDRAQSEPDAAYAINAEAVRILAQEAHALGSVVLHFSTDYVFAGDGTAPHLETDPTAPVSVYGSSKLAGEQALAASGAAHLILRTSWIYGASGHNFLLTILRLARERAQLTVVADQYGAPTWSHELARISVALLQQCEAAASGRTLVQAVRDVQGVYHAACAGETTWFGFAEHALQRARAAEPATRFAELIPIPTSQYPTAAARPPNSRLSSDKLERVFGFRLTDWQSAVEEAMHVLYAGR